MLLYLMITIPEPPFAEPSTEPPPPPPVPGVPEIALPYPSTDFLPAPPPPVPPIPAA